MSAGIGSVASAVVHPDQVDSFPGNGTWTKPEWAKTVEFTLIGGGQGGGQGCVGSLLAQGGHGGQGGQIVFASYVATTLAASYSITIGQGTAVTVPVTTNNATGASCPAGGSTAVGSLLTAAGGSAGGLGGVKNPPGGVFTRAPENATATRCAGGGFGGFGDDGGYANNGGIGGSAGALVGGKAGLAGSHAFPPADPNAINGGNGASVPVGTAASGSGGGGSAFNMNVGLHGTPGNGGGYGAGGGGGNAGRKTLPVGGTGGPGIVVVVSKAI